MKLNQELINRLSNGEIQLQHTGTVKQLNRILHGAFSETIGSVGACIYYIRSYKNHNDYISYNEPKDLPIFTTEDFFESEQKNDSGDTITPEVRELAKELFVAFMYAGNLPAYVSMNKAIEMAKEFVRMLDEA